MDYWAALTCQLLACNWLSEPIVDMLNIPLLAKRAFMATIVDFYQNNSWHFQGGFDEQNPGLCHSVVVSTKPNLLV